jgi:hypothetical protein
VCRQGRGGKEGGRVRGVQSVRAKCVQDACEGEWSQATVGYGTSGGKWREE